MKITTIGIDLAKSVFQLHDIDAQGKTVLKKQLPPSKMLAYFANLPPCCIGMEACGVKRSGRNGVGCAGGEMGPAVSGGAPIVASQVGKSVGLLPLSGRHPQGDLHHQRHRVSSPAVP